MSKTFDFANTSISSQFNMDLVNEGYIWLESRTPLFYRTVLEGITNYMKSNRLKKEDKVIFKLKDEKGVFKFGASLIYQKPEEDAEEDSGNWYLQFTFDEDDLKYESDESVRDLDNLNDSFYTIMAQVANSVMYGSFKSAMFMNRLCNIAIDDLIKWLDTNASEEEDINIELRGIFTASVAVEGGKKVMGIVPGEVIKQIVKDDSAL